VFHQNVVLIGDAAHSGHFSIVRAKLAMEDAIALARILSRGPDLKKALPAYQDERMTEALRLQNAARNSMGVIREVKRYVHLEPSSSLTRSHPQPARKSRKPAAARPQISGGDGAAGRLCIAGVETALRAVSGIETNSTNVHALQATRDDCATRWWLAMDMYTAHDGTPNDFHLVHLGSRHSVARD